MVYRGVGAVLMGAGYSVAWFVGLLNTLVVVNRLAEGQPPEGFLPTALGAWAIIAYVHYRAKWFPFHRRKR